MSDGAAAEGARPGRVVVAAVVGVVAGGLMLWTFVGSGRRPPDLPEDLVHRAAAGDARAASCLKCHARDAAVPVPAGHTGRQDCDSCHQFAR